VTDAAGGLEYVHVAATEYLTAMHTGGRSKADIDAGRVLPGYTGTIVRDGYAGYTHLVDAHHACCGAHLIRDLAAFHRADPDAQFWAAAMADTLTDAHQHAQAAGHDRLAPEILADIRRRYRGAVAAGISDNPRPGQPARARRAHPRPPLPRPRRHGPCASWSISPCPSRITRPSAICARPRSSSAQPGGCWRTLAGLADFAVVRSYLSTAAKWGLDSYDVLTQLFTTGAWLPPAAEPC